MAVQIQARKDVGQRQWENWVSQDCFVTANLDRQGYGTRKNSEQRLLWFLQKGFISLYKAVYN